MPAPHVLLVEDSSFMATRVAETLEDIHNFYVTTVATADEVENALDEYDDIECIVSNYELPDTNGVKLAARINGGSTEPDVPIIILTGKALEPIANDAIRAGVTEFVYKGDHATGEMDVLANRIDTVIRAYGDR
ncbi:response regulator [Halonotius terrestris]|uniref:Response regulator n=1 Tax=Halonotius terrestris TaxID=2487750 RepID=A0A8J8P9C2_9EURY|nr:response regulator [Halonotius terrestris]TQQ81015.1 response regulator [Halonotius terrestris]